MVIIEKGRPNDRIAAHRPNIGLLWSSMPILQYLLSLLFLRRPANWREVNVTLPKNGIVCGWIGVNLRLQVRVHEDSIGPIPDTCIGVVASLLDTIFIRFKMRPCNGIKLYTWQWGYNTFWLCKSTFAPRVSRWALSTDLRQSWEHVLSEKEHRGVYALTLWTLPHVVVLCNKQSESRPNWTFPTGMVEDRENALALLSFILNHNRK